MRHNIDFRFGAHTQKMSVAIDQKGHTILIINLLVHAIIGSAGVSWCTLTENSVTATLVEPKSEQSANPRQLRVIFLQNIEKLARNGASITKVQRAKTV